MGWHPLSAEAIQAITSCRPNLYNRFDDGGYLIWFVPDRKVFVDSRFDPYDQQFLQEHFRVETSGAYHDLFQRYAIHCAFLPTTSPVAHSLTNDGWLRRFDRDGWVVLEQH